MHLPTNNCEMLLATDATTVPMAKTPRAANRTDLRPIICENEAHVGLFVSGELAITSSGGLYWRCCSRDISQERKSQEELLSRQPRIGRKVLPGYVLKDGGA
jgi:hypothetical protein